MPTQDQYPLTRGKQQLIRVNLLQYLWRDTNGYLLHPAVESGSKSLKICDVATASGLWLCEVESEAPGVHQLHGFDISSNSFIAPEHLPGSVQLRVMDASKPATEEFKGQFDVVHIRLMQSVVMNDDPSWIITHALELLRPGGYLQWEEFDPLAVAVLGGDGKVDNLRKLTDILQRRVPGSWIKNLPKHLEKQGMHVASIDRKTELPFHHAIVTYLFCQVAEEYATAYLDVSGPPGSGDQARSLAQDSFTEALQGSYAEHMFQTVVARKPK